MEQARTARNIYFKAINTHKAQHWQDFIKQAQGKTAFTWILQVIHEKNRQINFRELQLWRGAESKASADRLQKVQPEPEENEREVKGPGYESGITAS